jgi:hypothetical protein
MKLGLIPPMGYDYMALRSNFHLVLPQYLKYERFIQTYNQAALRGDYIVLDNGAAEGTGIMGNDGSELMRAAKILCANEIVVPDVLGNRMATQEAVFDFIRHCTPEAAKAKKMAVAHGADLLDVRACIRRLERQPSIKVLGLPRYLPTYKQAGRIDIANWVQEHFLGRFEIHFLGAAPSWPQELKYAAKYVPFVRSMDTSMPFNFALAKEKLTDRTRQVIARPKDYFATYQVVDSNLLENNIRTMLEWARGEETSTSEL